MGFNSGFKGLSDRVKQTDANVAIRAPGLLVTISNNRNMRLISLQKYVHHLQNTQIIFSVYFPTNALRNVTYLTHTKIPTCFGTQVPSSGSNYKRGVRANLLIYFHCCTVRVASVISLIYELMHTLYTLRKH